VESIGRITLPASARALLGDRQTAQALSRGCALVMKRGGTGAAVVVDRRGRVVLPSWLRRATRVSTAVLLSACHVEGGVIVVVPATELDAIVERAAGEAR
jgi:bifunctional DNA-binding transcriptional regulator/antitoxin component of YhaV-PrlF toxin-antitoxin module